MAYYMMYEDKKGKYEVIDITKSIIFTKESKYTKVGACSLKEIDLFTSMFNNSNELKKQLLVDCFYACKVIAMLIHPIAPEGCEMFKDYLNIGDEIWNWDNIFEPINFYFKDSENHKFKFLEPKVDFFKKMDYQY